MGFYLGLPSFIIRDKFSLLSYIEDKARLRVQGWKHKLLSHVKKEILFKSMMVAIFTYTMSCFIVPKSVCNSIQSIQKKFWQGNGENEKKINYIACDKLQQSKRDEGLRFRDLHTFNLALLVKQAWRVLHNHNSLRFRIFQSLYFLISFFLSTKPKNDNLWAWKSILRGIEFFSKCLIWKVGNGQDINIWGNPWIPNAPNFIFFPYSPYSY